MYKVFTKLLANRIQLVIASVISVEQSAFIRGCQILDDIVVANEVVHEIQSQKKPSFLFKVDFEKAYDSVSWEFLLYVMACIGFSPTWYMWIRACLFYARISILVNGSPTVEFSPGRGLRQGDPLSPFLFLIVAEVFSRLLQRVKELGLFTSI
jgi:hypothetical protein